jgi:hypothetical protein
VAKYRSTGLGRRALFYVIAGASLLTIVAATPFPVLAPGPGSGPLRIGVIGAGREGGALGTAFAKAGHPIMFSSRHPEQLTDLVAAAGPLTKAGTVEQAIAFADVVLLVVPYSAVEQIGKDYGKPLATKQLVIGGCPTCAGFSLALHEKAILILAGGPNVRIPVPFKAVIGLSAL